MQNVYLKKQNLIAKYYQKQKDLELQRKQINAQLKKCTEKFEELITTEADPKQLELFENMDQYLLEE